MPVFNADGTVKFPVYVKIAEKSDGTRKGPKKPSMKLSETQEQMASKIRTLVRAAGVRLVTALRVCVCVRHAVP